LLPDWATVVNRRLAKAMEASLASERAYWLSETEQAIVAMKALG
jgi:hypothetical protein